MQRVQGALINDVTCYTNVCRQTSHNWIYILSKKRNKEKLSTPLTSCRQFCGPHAGLMYGRREVLASLAPYKLAACTDLLPGPASAQSSRWETGK